MAQSEERVIRPPFEEIASGKVFQPTNAFIGKKILKVGIILILIWGLLWLLHIGLQDAFWGMILKAGWEPFELLSLVGWEMTSYAYSIIVVIVLVFGTIAVVIYVKRIEYSVLGHSGEAMPEIYTKRGIITITKRHVPFRTVTHVQTRRGVFDRIMGIGTVLIETAGGSVGPPPTGLIGLLFSKAGAGNSEERVEGIKFHEELRDYILREMREIGSASPVDEKGAAKRHVRRIFTESTLEAFKEVRDALKQSREGV
jgi:uncharacterized membrane protein YdbT with pleckstrin-like domain